MLHQPVCLKLRSAFIMQHYLIEYRVLANVQTLNIMGECSRMSYLTGQSDPEPYGGGRIPVNPSRNVASMATLLSVIERVRTNQTDESDWLYIQGPAQDLTLQTEADLGCPESGEDSGEEIDPVGFAERGLQSTIDVQTLEDCISWADRLSASQDNVAALIVIRYYIQFDAFPETLNTPDPPSGDEILRRLDREFCYKLGPEDSSKQCRRHGCNRGVVNLSVFCRRHHFENVKNRPYPFAD